MGVLFGVRVAKGVWCPLELLLIVLLSMCMSSSYSEDFVCFFFLLVCFFVCEQGKFLISRGEIIESG